MDNELINAFKQLLKNEINPINEKLNKMDSKINTIDNKFENIKRQLNENTSILRALEHASKVHKAEIDNIKYQTANISGEVNKQKKETNEKLNNINKAIKDIHSDLSLANITASKNRIDIELIKNIINK